MTDEERDRVLAFLRDYEEICWRHRVVVTAGHEELNAEPIRCERTLDVLLCELRISVALN